MSERSIRYVPGWRYANLHPDYVMAHDLNVGYGLFPIHQETGMPCECRMEWNEDGTRLACPTCGLEGT